MTRLEIALNQIRAARAYTVKLLDTIPESDWFRQPAEGVTHVAWQVGHLAIAQYRLALDRIRGSQPGDAALIPANFAELFGRLSVPSADARRYPAPAEIRAAFDRVHARALEDVAKVSDGDLDSRTDPHPQFNTKIGALLWCGQHEMIHAGQIGLLRRLLKHEPLW